MSLMSLNWTLTMAKMVKVYITYHTQKGKTVITIYLPGKMRPLNFLLKHKIIPPVILFGKYLTQASGSTLHPGNPALVKASPVKGRDTFQGAHRYYKYVSTRSPSILTFLVAMAAICKTALLQILHQHLGVREQKPCFQIFFLQTQWGWILAT